MVTMVTMATGLTYNTSEQTFVELFPTCMGERANGPSALVECCFVVWWFDASSPWRAQR